MRRVALLLLVAASLSAQDAYLVKDINNTTNESPASSSPGFFFRHGSLIYFSALTQNGQELWTTDGTEAGTKLVADIDPGSRSSAPSYFAVVNGNLLFNARDVRGEELWITDGTQAGTRLLADMFSGAASSSPGDRIVFEGKMIFSADNDVNGRELWITDGTSVGTRFFKDLTPGPNDSSPRGFVLFNGTIYFGAANALWKSDGTEAGTVIVKSGVSPRDLVVSGSRIFFSGSDSQNGSEPWVSDGTEAGTRRIKDIRPGTEGSFSSAFATYTPFRGGVLFNPVDGVHGQELWISDGTEAGTYMLLDIAPGLSSSAYLHTIAVIGDRAVFSAQPDQGFASLWQTDGTSSGTTQIRNFGASSLRELVAMGNRVYFSKRGEGSAEIWVTDGTSAGTSRVTDEHQRVSVEDFTLIDGTLYFAGANSLNGYEPWKSDGTTAGTKMIANLAKDSAPSSEPKLFRVAGDYVYFAAWDGSVTPSLTPGEDTFWRTDGTSEGTIEIREEIPDQYPAAVAVDRLMFFRANTWPYPLWITDGTLEGTEQAIEFTQRFPEVPSIIGRLGDKLFVASDGDLWSTTLAPGAPAVRLESEIPFSFTELAGRALYFSGAVLWITDGTPEGTHVVRNSTESAGSTLVIMGGHAYFTAGTSERKLWRTDGTAEGTVAVTTVPNSFLGEVVAGKLLFFRQGESGPLWVTDGTAEGTRQLPASPSGSLAVIGNSVVFLGRDDAHGIEPWISDGTVEGTRMLRDINPGNIGSSGASMTGAASVAYFRAYTQLEGNELWMTDGTPEGTKLVEDIEPGFGNSFPEALVRAGERVIFRARTLATGHELWAIDLPAGSRASIKDVRVAETNSGTPIARFTVTLSSASTQTITIEYATSDGTASASTDYVSASGRLTFAPGETAKGFDVQVRGDNAMEGNETFLVTLKNATNAKIESSVGAGIIEDDDRAADVALEFDHSTVGDVIIDLTNLGPSVATNLFASMTAVPLNYVPSSCLDCRLVQLAPNQRRRALSYREPFHQQYLTATATALERDPNPSNNVLSWTTNGILMMDSMHLTVGSSAKIWLRLAQPITLYNVESTDSSVVAVPASVNGPQNFVVQGLKAGRATVRVFTPQQQIGTIIVDVLAPGAKMRFPDGMEFFPNDSDVPFGRRGGIKMFGIGMAPFTGLRPTGTVTVMGNGVELGRMQLAGDGKEAFVPFDLPVFGTYTVFAHYAGDDNFLPVTSPTWQIESERANVELSATATRYGDDVVVRARVKGSPLAQPTGNITYGTTNTPLVAMGPDSSEAEFTVTNFTGATIVLRYPGDTHYLASQVTVRVSDGRRRGSRH